MSVYPLDTDGIGLGVLVELFQWKRPYVFRPLVVRSWRASWSEMFTACF